MTMGLMETIWIGLEDLPHSFNLLAYDNWVADWNLNDELIRNIVELPNQVSCLPQKIMLNLERLILVLCIVAKNCKYFRQFGNMIPSYIPHQYSTKRTMQSQIVGLNFVTFY